MPARDMALERLWRDRIKRHAESGITARKFAEQEGVPLHQLAWWRRELKRRDAVSNGDSSGSRKRKRKTAKPSPSTSVAEFLPVAVTSSPTSSAAPLEIILDQPLRIAVSPGFDSELLRQVVRALERDAC